MSPQAHLLGVPNSALGVGAFTALAAIGVIVLFGTKLSRPSLILLGFGSIGGLAMVGYFLYQSATNFATLCPYCMMVWSATMIVASILIPAMLVGFDATIGAGQTMLRYSWASIVILHLIVLLIVLFTMTDQIGGLL